MTIRSGRKALARPLGLAALATVIGAGLLLGQVRALAETKPVLAPTPAVDETVAPTSTEETAIFAGGCFWGVQGVFQHVNGVTNAVSGYSGGAASTAKYMLVSDGDTGHAESVEVTFDPHKVTYGTLLRTYFSVITDPTQFDRQGPDVGSQYRSALFPQNDDQKRVAEAYIAQLGQAGIYDKPIVTKVETFKGFYPAEAHHQNYLTLNPQSTYIYFNDRTKVEALQKQFPDLYRTDPVLVAIATD